MAAADKNGFYLFKIRAIDLYALVKAAMHMVKKEPGDGTSPECAICL